MRPIVLMLSCLLILTSCSLLPGGATPEAAAMRQVQQIGSGGAMQLHGVRQAPTGKIVLYSQQAADQSGPPSAWGYVLTEQRGETWIPTSSAWGRGTPRGPIQYSIVMIPGIQGEDLLLYGRAVSSDVATIEARMDTGQVVRDVPTEMFAIVAPDAIAVCDLRVFDTHGQVLQQFDLLDPQWSPPMAEDVRQQAAQKCGR